MNRALQHPLVWCALAATVAALGLYVPASGQGDGKKLPIIETRAHANYVETVEGTKVSFDMVAIPGGTYLMGSSENESGRKPDEGPQHPVTVKAFWMGKTEVTWDEYDLYWKKKKGVVAKDPNPGEKDKAADAVSRPTPPYDDETFGHGRKGNPVLCITHHAAMEYCRWLSAKTGKTYRLPTEAEWEWACRAGTTTAFSFGDDPQGLDDVAWYDKNSEDVAHKVRQKKANPWGLHDMHGNVSEWCVDHYVKDGYKKFDLGKPFLQPVELPTDARYSYVVRGGSWADPPAMLRSAARRGSNKDWLRRDPQRPQSIWWMTDADFVGFRVVRPVEEQENLKGLKSKVTRESD
jgi:formylglycine-generating enzyme required for sulfatase activity